MKKLFAMLTAALLLVPVTAAAEEEQSSSPEETTEAEELLYEYELDAEGNAQLNHFIPAETYEGALVIPSEIEGHPVDYIGNACFMNAKGITEITIPAGVTDMGSSVFFGCTALTAFHVEEGNPYYSVTSDGVLLADNGGMLTAYPAGKEDTTYEIPSSVDEIGPGAFGFTEHLTELEIPEGVQFIDNWAFGYSGLQKIVIAGSVQLIDTYAFAYSSNLNEVELKNGIQEISHAAFAGTSSLTQVTLPDSLTSIGQYAFCGTGMSCVTIPNSLEEISYCAFGYDSDYKSVPGFIIYGEPYTMAQHYATASDPDNNYENHFEFIAVMDASVPYELGEGELYVEPEETEPPVPTEIDENGQIIIIETDQYGNRVDPTEELGAGLKDNRRVQLILGIGSGIAIILGIILIGAYAKKPKKTASADTDKVKEAPAASDEAEHASGEDNA